jgi:D-alanine--poly(phosphoribitol) ligase subunit 2
MVRTEDIEAELLAFLRREVFAPEVPVTPDMDLIAAGFDSMSLVRVLVFLETTYGKWIPESELTPDALRSPQQLAGTFSRLLNNA